MKHWNINDIPWQDFDTSRVNPALIPIVKAASLVEYNSAEYANYLASVFSGDEEFIALARNWAEEEIQHGEALRRWAELADPSFNFETSFNRFITGYQQVPKDATASVRGSKSGELIARCIVEMGTSNYYTAIKENCDEPVLKAISAKIAADEHRHYKLFYTALQRYQVSEDLSLWGRIRVALSRVAESEDDELAYAYYSANTDGSVPYERKQYSRLYAKHVYSLYARRHIDSMAAMLFKAVGLKPHTRLFKTLTATIWKLLTLRARMLGVRPLVA